LSKQDRCRFFQWIDGPEIFDPQILLFPYDRNESSPLRSFKRWVPLPPNPLPLTNEEKDETSTCRVHNPPVCRCGYRAELCARRMAEHKHATYFAMQREMAREDYKEKWEEERAWKRKKARRVKEAYARGGVIALMKGKWPRLTNVLY
jgi:hypothetical protein